jgi:hypothetical protein
MNDSFCFVWLPGLPPEILSGAAIIESAALIVRRLVDE